MLLSFLLLSLGFGLLWKGGDYLLDGSIAIAHRFRIPEFVIGVTLIAFGTSAPELAVSIFAILQHKSDIIFGNILGSNIANIFLILGITSTITALSVSALALRRELVISMASILLMWLLIYLPFSPPPLYIDLKRSCILLICFGLFLIYSMKNKRHDRPPPVETPPCLLKATGFFVLGCLLLPLGGHLTVQSAIALASGLGLSELVISIFAIAIGTSLPELVTSILAACRHKPQMVVGNILGSNIFNCLFVLGFTGLFGSISFNPKLNLEIVVILGASLLFLLLVLLPTRFKLSRWQGIFLLVCYVLYCFHLFMTA